MLLAVCATAFAFGIMCVLNADFAWEIYKLDARFTGARIERSSRSDLHMMIRGVLLMMFGGIGILVGLGYISL